MGDNIQVNGITYPNVESLSLETPEGKNVMYYPDAVRYNEQELTEEQQTQARENIGAASAEEVKRQSEEIAGKIDKTQLSQEAGDSESLIMSQKAVTDLVAEAVESGGGTIEYETVGSVEEMTDTSKSYVLSSTGTIWAYGEVGTQPAFTDLANNFEAGRINSSGNIVAQDGAYTCVDFVPFTQGTIVRIQGFRALTDYNTAIYKSTATVFSCSKANVSSSFFAYSYDSTSDIVTFKALSADIKYVRFSGIPTTTIDNIIITANEEITYTTGYGWYDTEMTPSASGGGGGGNYVNLLVKVNKNTTDIRNLERQLTEIEVDSASGSISIPFYWENEIAEKSATVKELQVAGGKDCISFARTGDTHIPDNDNGKTTYLGRLMAKVLNNCNIPFATIEGDVGTRGSYSTEEDFVSTHEQLPVHLAPLWGTDRLLIALGNHDGCYGDSAGYYKKQFPPERMWELYFRTQALDFRRVFSADGTYYYVDNIPQKTRFIVLNSNFGGNYAIDSNGWAVNNRFSTSCYGQEQLDWLVDVLRNMPKGYDATIHAHVPPNIEYTVDKAQLIGIINAYNRKTTFKGSYTAGVAGWTNSVIDVDFTNSNGEVMGFFAGHVHWDIVDTTTMDCPIITIISAGASVNEYNMKEGETIPTRVAGTDTETSFDVVTINKKTRTIYCTRVGAGSDRQVSY